jgi:membrane glycosyltransferase
MGALALVGVTLSLLFFPKLLAALDAVLGRRLADHGGVTRLTSSILLETLVSALLAPIRMLAHTRYVLEALFNTTLRWAGQNRSDETRWRDAFVNQAPGTVLALGWAGFAWWLDPAFFYWTLPVAVPLILAAPTSVMLGRVRAGRWLHGRGLLRVAEPNPMGAQGDVPALLPRDGAPCFERVVLDPQINRVHRACCRTARAGARARHVQMLLARCLSEGPVSLSRRELCLLSDDAGALATLHERAWKSSPDSWWGQALSRHVRAWSRSHEAEAGAQGPVVSERS